MVNTTLGPCSGVQDSNLGSKTGSSGNHFVFFSVSPGKRRDLLDRALDRRVDGVPAEIRTWQLHNTKSSSSLYQPSEFTILIQNIFSVRRYY